MDSYLDLVLHIERPQPGLLEEVHERFPFVVKVRLVLPEPEEGGADRSTKAWDELYVDFVQLDTGEEPSEGLLAAFRSVMDEAAR